MVEALKLSFSHCNLSSSASVGICSKAFSYSTSCQPALEVGDSSAGEVREESQMQKSGCARENIEENRQEILSKTQVFEKVQLHLKADQQEHAGRLPLKEVVQSCVRRWFKEQLRNAEKGDPDAQVIVGQMISHGYGVPKDVQKGEGWIRRAPRKHKQSKESSEKKRSEDEDLYFM